MGTNSWGQVTAKSAMEWQREDKRGTGKLCKERAQVLVPLIRTGAHCHKNSVSHSQDN